MTFLWALSCERPPKPPTFWNSHTRTLILDTIMKLSGTIGVTQKTMTFETHVCLILLHTLNPQERWGTHKKRWRGFIFPSSAAPHLSDTVAVGLRLHASRPRGRPAEALPIYLCKSFFTQKCNRFSPLLMWKVNGSVLFSNKLVKATFWSVISAIWAWRIFANLLCWV